MNNHGHIVGIALRIDGSEEGGGVRRICVGSIGELSAGGCAGGFGIGELLVSIIDAVVEIALTAFHHFEVAVPSAVAVDGEALLRLHLIAPFRVGSSECHVEGHCGRGQIAYPVPVLLQFHLGF